MENYYRTNGQLLKVAPPKKGDIITIRALICLAFVSMVIFICWFCNPEHVGFTPIFVLLTFALLFKLVKMLHEWYHYWSVSVPKIPENTRTWTVDMLTTACPGEPREMIMRTLKAMKAVRYPHTNYLCDEGNDPVLKQFCDEHGIVHVTRAIKVDAKAGNINNALKQATGEICVVLDPDHEPVPEFLDRVLPYFEDDGIGFVQCVQGYHNQGESLIARGAAEQTYHFYGPMMMCMNTYGTVQAIGANCTFRRKALDSIGGHAAGLSEDMHTAMQIHAKGWRSVYVPEMLTRGLVPATLSAYYKQQLKWSRGTFELLFRTFPKLCKNFTWRQKIHYFTIPLYFLFGLINLIDIVIPLAALALAEVPWEVNLGLFAVYFLPVCALSLVIRLFAQRWLLEKHERGFHFAGGVLRLATWWIFLVGFVYTIFRIKVPYIPTPKEDVHQNYWRLSLPNLLVALLTVTGVLYGLSIDWTPYSLAMAFYGLMNAAMLFVVIALSQQKLVLQITGALQRSTTANFVYQYSGRVLSKGQGWVYGLVRNGPVAILVAVSLVFLSYSNMEEESERSATYKPKEFGGFYTGIYTGEDPGVSAAKIGQLQVNLGNRFETVAFDRTWSDNNDLIPSYFFDSPATPFVHWQPAYGMDTAATLQDIVAGAYDDYLTKCGAALRKFGRPVFISFSPTFNASENSQKYAQQFIRAWQYAYTFFNNLGISNLTWVFNPAPHNASAFYPGPKFTDWVGASCINYGTDQNDNDWYSFSELYEPYRQELGQFGKPVFVTSLASINGNYQGTWQKEALADISSKFHEIKGVILHSSEMRFYDQNRSDSLVYTADFTLEGRRSVEILKEALTAEPFNNEPFTSGRLMLSATSASHSRRIEGVPGKFSMIVDGKPYYIRGVAYNTAHDWRDGNMPLTRRQVERDFAQLKAMGANTLRRYDHGIYDKNVLNIAEEYDLKVLYGFWFDPKVDYYRDTNRVKEYMEQVEAKVLEFKDHRSVLAWSLGNETWGLLKHRYAKPYLTEVRRSYVQMIEKLAQRIHELDPTRAVFSCMEHEEYQLPGEIVAFRDGAPSVDVIGINSYYKEQISHLNHVTWQFDSLRPYLVSEFGPRGYWDPSYNRTKNGKLIEDAEKEKAEWYKDQWTNYVSAFRGYNIGGFAYCWHDRMEGSYTWFGLTDYKSRLKPGYYALKELWASERTAVTLPSYSITMPTGIVAGKEYVCTATCEEQVNNKFNYEWYLLKDEYLDRVDAIEPMRDGQAIQLTVPEEPSNYRLYLYVSDDQGNVTTASAPLYVR
jgi:cellulose synthase (UDP-forming)